MLCQSGVTRFCLLIICVTMPTGNLCAQPKPAPLMQAVPQPYEQVSFQRDGSEIARYHYGPSLRRPFLFPLIGPAGRSLTRMGHPHDPVGHSHHNSVWVAHNNINGVDFWGDSGKGRIIHQRVDKLTDEDEGASILVVNAWVDESAKKTLMTERRKMTVQPLNKGEWLLLLDLQLEAKEEVTIGKSAFGMVGVRMAKSIGVHDGGGVIRNSDGKVNEKEVFWKPAKWVDYSGAITAKSVEGITLMDHPANPNHPSGFHVRGDGWMGSSLTLDAPCKLVPGQPLRLRYGLYIHAVQPELAALEQRWAVFAKTTLDDLTPRKKR